MIHIKTKYYEEYIPNSAVLSLSRLFSEPSVLIVKYADGRETRIKVKHPDIVLGDYRNHWATEVIEVD